MSRTLCSLLGITLLGLAALLLTGCNTTEGVGEDIEALGDSIDDAAEDAND